MHVDFGVIESRYPALYPFYCDWAQFYDTTFWKQGCYLGSDAELFPDVHEDVAWDVEGCLMALWLALDENVKQVEYHPHKIKYLLIEEKLENFFKDFLNDSDMRLESGNYETGDGWEENKVY